MRTDILVVRPLVMNITMATSQVSVSLLGYLTPEKIVIGFRYLVILRGEALARKFGKLSLVQNQCFHTVATIDKTDGYSPA